MRHLVILSGNSLKNKAWGEAALEHFGPKFDSSFMLQYDHWDSGEASLDFAKEEAKLRAHVNSLPTGTEVTLMAKSAGSLLVFLASYHQAVTPVRCVFFGIPFDLAATGLFLNDWSPVKNFTVPATAFHNVADPTTSYEFTKSTLKQYAPHITLVTTHEADHWYGDFTTYGIYLNHAPK